MQVYLYFLRFIFSCLDGSKEFSVNIKEIQLFSYSNDSPNDQLFNKHMQLINNVRDIEPYLSSECLLKFSQAAGTLYSYLLLYENLLENNEETLWPTIKSSCIKHMICLKEEKKKILVDGFENDMLFRKPINTCFDQKHASSGIEFISPYTITTSNNMKNAYGLLNMPLNRHLIYTWTFQLDQGKYACFGISKELFPSNTHQQCQDTWIFNAQDGIIYHDSNIFKTKPLGMNAGDIITLEFNMKAYTLMFKINGGGKFGIFHLPKDYVYYPYVLLFGNTKVTLLSFYYYDDPLIPTKVSSVSNIKYAPEEEESLGPIVISNDLHYNKCSMLVGEKNTEKSSFTIPTDNYFSMIGYIGVSDNFDKDNMEFNGTCIVEVSDNNDTFLYRCTVEQDMQYPIQLKLSNVDSITFTFTRSEASDKFIIGLYDTYFYTYNQSKFINSLPISEESENIYEFIKDELSIINDVSIVIPKPSIFQTPNMPLWYGLTDNSIIIFGNLLRLFNTNPNKYIEIFAQILKLIQSNFKIFVTQQLDPLQCGLWIDKDDNYELSSNMGELLKELIKASNILEYDMVTLVYDTIVEGYLLLFPTNKYRVEFLLKNSQEKTLFKYLSKISVSPLIISSFFLEFKNNMEIILELVETLLLISRLKFEEIIDNLIKGDNIKENQEELKIITDFLTIFQQHYFVEINLNNENNSFNKYISILFNTIIEILEYIQKSEYLMIEYNLLISPAGKLFKDLLLFIYAHSDNINIANNIIDNVLDITKKWDETFSKIDDNFNKCEKVILSQNETIWETKDYRSTPYNINLSIENGNSDVLTGDYGYTFIPKEDLILYKLGRAVSLVDGKRRLNRSHNIKLFDNDNKIIGMVTVDQYSDIDTLGYAYEDLIYPIYLNKDSKYKISVGECMQSGDVWYKNSDYSKILNYRSNLIEILNEKDEPTKSDKEERNYQIQSNKILIAYGTATFYILKKSEYTERILPLLEYFNLEESDKECNIGPSVQTISAPQDNSYRYVYTSENNNFILDFIINIEYIYPDAELLFGYTNEIKPDATYPYGYYISSNGYIFNGIERKECKLMDLENDSIIRVRINTRNGNMLVSTERNNYGYVLGNDHVNPILKNNINGPLSLIFFLKGDINCHVYIYDIAHDDKIPFYYEDERLLASVCGLLCSTNIAGLPYDKDEEKLLQYEDSIILKSGQEICNDNNSLPNILIDKDLNDVVDEICDLNNETGKKIYNWYNNTFPHNTVTKPNEMIDRLYFALLVKQCDIYDEIQVLEDSFDNPNVKLDYIKKNGREIWNGIITLRRFLDGKYNEIRQNDEENYQVRKKIINNKIIERIKFLLTFTSCRDDLNSLLPNKSGGDDINLSIKLSLSIRRSKSNSILIIYISTSSFILKKIIIRRLSRSKSSST